METTRFQPILARVKSSLAIFCVLALGTASLAWFASSRKPRVWTASDVPVAFWAWRNETPSEEEVERARNETRASALFLRAGQIHQENGELSRVRAVKGRFPRGIDLHLVYNGTRALLSEFERIDASKLAALIVETYTQDSGRASQDGAKLAGLQLDIDAPTRLLPRYAQVLRATRERLPKDVQLSITGLPTWMESKALGEVLDAVDFWIPQCYGAQIPERLEQVSPISSPQTVSRIVSRARALNRPFYAGLAAYGYTILYDARGALIAVRGDLDPTHIARDANFELIERRPFDAQAQAPVDKPAAIASEWRYLYRARADAVVDGLVVRAGETLMLDQPSLETLRESARSVRREAGDNLLGICVYRLPANDDPSTLTFGQIATALSDTQAITSTEVKASRIEPHSFDEQGGKHLLRVTASNRGTMSAVMDMDALVLDIRLPAGAVRGVRVEGFDSVETLCEGPDSKGADSETRARPCGEPRANVLRLKANTWMAGASAQAFLKLDEDPSPRLETFVRVLTDDGRVWRRGQQITISKGGAR